ncbi:MAG: trypsin-like serine protease [Clostridiales bacterium]|nr:trypsin-like serine protease [Clostridiales bacterium]
MDNNYFDNNKAYPHNAEAENNKIHNFRTSPMYVSSTQNQQDTNQSFISEQSKKNMKEMYEYYKFYNIDKKTPKVFSKGSIGLLITILSLIVALTLYCVITDIAKGSLSNNVMANVNKQFFLQTEEKPNVEEQFKDESGRYTTEGIAQLLKPSIVEIFTYNTQISNTNPVGSGSGIIMSTDGYIATNSHVLDNATDFKVVLSDGVEHRAQIVGKDSKTDIAVVKINATNLINATFGDSSTVKVGEQVMAIGNPAGLTGTVTDGIVSGINRPIKTDAVGFEMDCIQTNAAISPGNSGGALVNMYGQVIGITSSKYVDSSYEGLGFAITINEAKPILEELMLNGYVSNRVKVGISFYESSTEIANNLFKEQFNYDIPEDINGLFILQIDETCDIANTDLQLYDFITSAEGVDVFDYDSFISVTKDKKADDTIRAKVVRLDKDENKIEFEIEFKLMADTSGYY